MARGDQSVVEAAPDYQGRSRPRGITALFAGDDRAAAPVDAAAIKRFHEQMQNLLALEPVENLEDAARPDVTLAITRGVLRLFVDLGFAPLCEFRLPNGRRADLAGLDAKGRLVIAEVKSCQADFETDGKWEDYLGFCDEFYFAVARDFPQSLLPEDEGLIIADAFGGAILRAGRERPMAAARRKAMTLRFARQAAARAAALGVRFDA